MQPQYKKLTDLLQLIPPEKQPIAKKLITELNFMSSTLAKLRKDINANGAVEEFKNGKQEMLRESPAFKSYTTMTQRYSTLFKQLTDLLPKDEPGKQRQGGGGDIYDFIRGE